MAKRFIDTNFFKDPFVRGLPSPLRSFYIYLFLDCSNGGLWDVEIDVARLRCGIPEKFTDEEIIKTLSPKIIQVDNGQKWLVKNFLKIQHKGELNVKNKAHKNVIPELQKHELLTETEEGIFILKEEETSPLVSPLIRNDLGSKVMVKVKEEGKSKGKGKSEKEEKAELILPWDSEKFRVQWMHWKVYKKKEFGFNYKTIQSEQAALMKLSELSNGLELKAIRIILESMSNGWKGFFKLKTDKNEQSNKSNEEIFADAVTSETGRNFKFK